MNTLNNLLKENKIDSVPIDFGESTKLLKSAEEDIFFARKTFKDSVKWGFTILYHAAIKILRGLLISKGLRTKGESQHISLLQTGEILLGQNLKDLFDFLNMMRRKRHHFVYSADETISQADLKEGFKRVESLLDLVQKYIQVNNPQEKLFKE